MFRTKRADWLFIIPATLVWAAALVVTGRDVRKRLDDGSFRLGWLNLVGLGIMVSGVAVRLVARKALGRQFSYALRMLDDHKLITGGIYRYVRHPAYAGDLIFHFGVPLLFASTRGLPVMLLLIPCMLYRIGIEEQMLGERFGTAYWDYRRTSRKMIPFLY